MTDPPTGRGIGVLSKQTGCHVETIRYYERIGLLSPASRSEGGHRLYDEAQRRRLGFIRRTRELGFTLNEVRALLGLVDGDRYTCAQVKRITVHHLDEVRRKVADLRTIEGVLAEMAARCDGGAVPKCPVIDALFAHSLAGCGRDASATRSKSAGSPRHRTSLSRPSPRRQPARHTTGRDRRL